MADNYLAVINRRIKIGNDKHSTIEVIYTVKKQDKADAWDNLREVYHSQIVFSTTKTNSKHAEITLLRIYPPTYWVTGQPFLDVAKERIDLDDTLLDRTKPREVN